MRVTAAVHVVVALCFVLSVAWTVAIPARPTRGQDDFDAEFDDESLGDPATPGQTRGGLCLPSCVHNGTVRPDGTDCRHFFVCSHLPSGRLALLRCKCPPESPVFNTYRQKCSEQSRCRVSCPPHTHIFSTWVWANYTDFNCQVDPDMLMKAEANLAAVQGGVSVSLSHYPVTLPATLTDPAAFHPILFPDTLSAPSGVHPVTLPAVLSGSHATRPSTVPQPSTSKPVLIPASLTKPYVMQATAVPSSVSTLSVDKPDLQPATLTEPLIQAPSTLPATLTSLSTVLPAAFPASATGQTSVLPVVSRPPVVISPCSPPVCVMANSRLQNPYSCRKYYKCVLSRGVLVARSYICPRVMPIFSPDLQMCIMGIKCRTPCSLPGGNGTIAISEVVPGTVINKLPGTLTVVTSLLGTVTSVLTQYGTSVISVPVHLQAWFHFLAQSLVLQHSQHSHRYYIIAC
ncbi:hypothetical protein C7M84_023771 [Penaeus vannamei]|uniref:Chitin-binding type-2 domain-containing protein n=1 Tax=Penaeus vannamei TaxID=6689 RepID=A0A423U2X1_PENVA|nr:hypothetical protein C7M84_023771 [Penaeus vannamei]